MVTNDATILRIKHDVLYEVAKLAWNGELDEEHKDQVPYTIIPGRHSSAAAFIKSARLSVSVSAWQRANARPAAKIPETWSRSLGQPVRSVRSHLTR